MRNLFCGVRYYYYICIVIKEILTMGKMTIRTKYAVGDDVWFIYDGREKHGTIHSIEIKVKTLVMVKYEIKIGSYLVTCDEVSIYPSLEVLLKKNKHIKR